MKKTGQLKLELGQHPKLQVKINTPNHSLLQLAGWKGKVLIMIRISKPLVVIMLMFNRQILHQGIISIKLLEHLHRSHPSFILRSIRPSIPVRLLLFRMGMLLMVPKMEVLVEIQMLHILIKKARLQIH